MTVVRVYVGTTEGPAEIQRITDEPPGIRSVVCLDGKAVALPISADYDSFVRRPTGVVERLFGHSAFRMDVGARITDGLSWQLGALLAHSLHAGSRLATAPQPADLAVWATGEVDAALTVRAVDAVPRKLQMSAALLRSLASAKVPILVLVPRDDGPAARSALLELELGEACQLVTVATAEDAFATLAPKQAARPPTKRAGEQPARLSRPSRPSRRRWLWAAAALPVLAAAAATLAVAASWREPFAEWQRLADAGELPRLQDALAATAATPDCLTCAKVAALFRDRLAAARPARSAIHVEATELSRAHFGDCEDASGLQARPVAQTADGNFTPSSPAGLCAVRYRVSGAPHIALILASSRGSVGEPATTIDIGSGAAQVEATVPHWIASPMENRLIVVAAASPLEPLLAAAAQPTGTADGLSANEWVPKLAAPSVLVFEVHHSIGP